MARSASAVAMARDYNQSLWVPVRWGHMAGAAVWGVVGPVVQWSRAEERRAWAWPLLLAAVLFAAIFPLDGPLFSMSAGLLRREGDVLRELRAWQQYGAVGSIIFAAAVIWSLDPARRRRLLDLFAAAGLTSIACWVLKGGLGRPRPALGDPHTILGPWAMYPVPTDNGFSLQYAWEFWKGDAELWSMPSSHTAAAAAMSVFLAANYPRLRWLCVAMVCVVGATRVLTGAHWPSDVAVGAVVGWAIARVTVDRYWGVRVVEWLWLRLVNRDSPLAFPPLARSLGDGALLRQLGYDGDGKDPRAGAAAGGRPGDGEGNGG
ncbi:MAG: phosphatase PAP2 family protein [Phycisphaeraceae bacterium]|nr:phosphatase PAP2 family protein [Phycisphaeraceae bacterium]